jgi:hypothetical protein
MTSPLNEVNIGSIEVPLMNNTQYIRIAKKLVARMKSEGLTDVQFAGPDIAKVELVNDYSNDLASDEVIGTQFKHVLSHNYFGLVGRLFSFATSHPGMTAWMAEWSNGN